MLLSDTHFTPVIGIDIHFTTVPPFNPFHPYIGMVIDPIDYIPFLGTNVHVNGIKRGNSDTSGIIIPLVHIPLFTPPWLMTPIIGHESMNFFASQTVFSDGMRLSPKGHLLMTCNDIGLPLSLTPGKVKIGKKMLPFAPTLFAPTSFSLPVPMGLPVTVGGPYVPDWGGMLTGLAASFGFSSLMKLGRKSASKLNAAYTKKARNLMSGIADNTPLPSGKKKIDAPTEYPKKLGGAHKDLDFDNTTQQRHHMPSQAAGNKGGNGGAIVMDTDDHKFTASCDNKPGAKEFRDRQKALVKQGKFDDALQMDIDDVNSKFPGKYDEAIEQLKEWYKINSL